MANRIKGAITCEEANLEIESAHSNHRFPRPHIEPKKLALFHNYPAAYQNMLKIPEFVDFSQIRSILGSDGTKSLFDLQKGMLILKYLSRSWNSILQQPSFSEVVE